MSLSELQNREIQTACNVCRLTCKWRLNAASGHPGTACTACPDASKQSVSKAQTLDNPASLVRTSVSHFLKCMGMGRLLTGPEISHCCPRLPPGLSQGLTSPLSQEAAPLSLCPPLSRRAPHGTCMHAAQLHVIPNAGEAPCLCAQVGMLGAASVHPATLPPAKSGEARARTIRTNTAQTNRLAACVEVAGVYGETPAAAGCKYNLCCAIITLLDRRCCRWRRRFAAPPDRPMVQRPPLPGWCAAPTRR